LVTIAVPMLKIRRWFQYLLRYSVEYADFCRLVAKVSVSVLVISGVSESILMKFAQDVEKILPCNICKSELRYSNPFWNANVLNR